MPAFAKGLQTTQADFEHQFSLWGGDTTHTDGPAVFSITLIGEIASGAMVQRAGSSVGNDIWVSGVLGDAKLGCDLVTKTCAALNFDALPFSLGAETWAEAQNNPVAARQVLASFGDDYGVVFTSKPESRQAIFDAARKAMLKLTLVGSMIPGQGSVCLDVEGQEMAWPNKGYRHK